MPFASYILLFLHLYSSPPSCLAKHFLVDVGDETITNASNPEPEAETKDNNKDDSAKDGIEEIATESGSEKGADYSMSKTQECDMCKEWGFCRWCLRCMNFQAGYGAEPAPSKVTGGIGLAKKFRDYGGGSRRSSINGCNSRCTVYNGILQNCWREPAFRPKKLTPASYARFQNRG